MGPGADRSGGQHESEADQQSECSPGSPPGERQHRQQGEATEQQAIETDSVENRAGIERQMGIEEEQQAGDLGPG